MGIEERQPFLRAPISNHVRVGSAQAGLTAGRSPPESELGDDPSVAFYVVALKVVEETAPFADQLQQATSRAVVVAVQLEMFGEVIDAFAEDRDLDFR